ncbi:MAG: hydrogen gas-evolving membrane-bound hydrogenase subunit E [Desulfohalobiaceae bacterium]
MRNLQLLTLIVFSLLLVYAISGLPPRGDLQAPAQQEVNPTGTQVAGAYYIQNAYKDAHTPNMVTVVLADYRSFDTLGETIVVFAGGIACMFILRRRPL